MMNLLPNDIYFYLFDLFSDSTYTIIILANVNQKLYKLCSKYAIENNLSRKIDCLHIAIKEYWEIFTWMHPDCCFQYGFHEDIWHCCSKTNNLEIIKWAYQKKYKWRVESSMYMVHFGNLEMLQFLHNKGYLFRNNICWSARTREIIIWLHQINPNCCKERNIIQYLK